MSRHDPGPFDPIEQATSDERSLLLAFLDDSRAEVLAAAEGLSDEQARTRLVASRTTPLGILKHLVSVERVWFHATLRGLTRTEVGTFEDAEDSWDLTDDDTVAGLTAELEQVCAESRAFVADHDLDHVMVHRRMGELSLRFVVLHVIREHSRHAGHLDILREQVLPA